MRIVWRLRKRCEIKSGGREEVGSKFVFGSWDEVGFGKLCGDCLGFVWVSIGACMLFLQKEGNTGIILF